MTEALTLTEVQEAHLGPRKGWEGRDWQVAQSIGLMLLARRSEGFVPVRVERGAVIFESVDSGLQVGVDPIFLRQHRREAERTLGPTVQAAGRLRVDPRRPWSLGAWLRGLFA